MQRGKTFNMLVDALDGDIDKAYELCRNLGGLTIKLPAKSHEISMAVYMLERGDSPEEILKKTDISQRTMNRIIERQLCKIK